MDFESVAVVAPHSKRTLMLIACGGLFVYGVLVAFLGAALPELRTRLSLTPDLSGLLFGFLYLPQILAVSAAGPLIDRSGTKLAVFLGAILCGAGFAGAGFAGSYRLLAVAMLVLGVGGSLLSSASNTLVADLYPENPASALNVGHALFGLGAVFFPAAVTLTESRMGLALPIGMTLFLTGGVAVLASSRDFPNRHAGRELNWLAARRAVSHPAVLILSAVVFLTTALAVSIGGWLRLYMEQQFSSSGHVSGLILTLFWGLTMTGRLTSSQVLKVVRGPQLVLWCSLGMLLGLLLLAMAPDRVMAVAGVVVCGLSYGPIYPTTVGSAGIHFREFFATVFGIMQAAGLIGGLVLPVAIGWVARIASFGAGLWLLVAAAILLVALQATFVGYERGMPSSRGGGRCS
ncbi:MAG: MFS transporter [Acidobacteriia bacterium]|nr:MFS transporter [Terriglobia bacterium]